MKSRFFYGNAHQSVAQAIMGKLNERPVLLTEQTANSTRAAGDAIETAITDNLESLLGDWCLEYSNAFSRRAMADLAFRDKDGFYCMADVKTHRTSTKFSMPNLTSVKRLRCFYDEDDMNIFSLIIVKYEINAHYVKVKNVIFCPIEFLDWQCLRLGALGWGQIQIANSTNIRIQKGCSRRDWMLRLCDELRPFYRKEIQKIKGRIDDFEQVRARWEGKEDIWA